MLSHLDPTAIAPRLDYVDRPESAWVTHGGVSANGTAYLAASHAIAWGRPGCPMVPSEVRERNEGVRLPYELEQALGAPITVDQLDRDILKELGIHYLLASVAKIFRQFLYSDSAYSASVAIPAGVPLRWLEALPLTGRTRGCVLKAFHAAGADDVLSMPMLAHEFLDVRSVGVSALNELTCVIESAAVEHADSDPVSDWDGATAEREVRQWVDPTNTVAGQVAEGMSSFNQYLTEFASWAMAETDAKTFGEAIAELIRIGEGNESWKQVASVSLTELATQPPHPYEVLDEWLEQLEPRSREIFRARVSSHPSSMLTLDELGSGFGVTRERIRQVEVKTRRLLNDFLDSKEALPIRWRASTLRWLLGVTAPVDTSEHLLRPPPGCNDHRSILLEMAGPYDRDDDWLSLRSAQHSDPTFVILSQVDEVGRVDTELATSLLNDWGLDVSLHERWLTRDPSIRLFNGQLVRWGSSISDRLAFALADIGRPATVDEMVAHVNEDRSRNSIINALGK